MSGAAGWLMAHRPVPELVILSGRHWWFGHRGRRENCRLPRSIWTTYREAATVWGQQRADTHPTLRLAIGSGRTESWPLGVSPKFLSGRIQGDERIRRFNRLPGAAVHRIVHDVLQPGPCICTQARRCRPGSGCRCWDIPSSLAQLSRSAAAVTAVVVPDRPFRGCQSAQSPGPARQAGWTGTSAAWQWYLPRSFGADRRRHGTRCSVPLAERGWPGRLTWSRGSHHTRSCHMCWRLRHTRD